MDIERLDFSKGPPPGWKKVELPEMLDPIWPLQTCGLRLPGYLKNGETAVGVGLMIIYQERKDLENNKYDSSASGGEENG